VTLQSVQIKKTTYYKVSKVEICLFIAALRKTKSRQHLVGQSCPVWPCEHSSTVAEHALQLQCIAQYLQVHPVTSMPLFVALLAESLS